MPTPAENSDIQIRSQTYRDGIYNSSTGSLTWNGAFEGIVGWSTRIRPKSISVQKDSSGFRFPTPWSAMYSSVRWPDITFGRYLQAPYWVAYTGCYGLELSRTELPSFPGNLEDRAITKALLKLKDQKVNFGVMFGERKETAKAVLEIAGNIGKQLNRFRTLTKMTKSQILALTASSIRKAPKGRYTRDFLNKYLALQYGIRPLISDAYGVVAELHRKEQDGNSYRVEVKGGAVVSTPIDQMYYDQGHVIGYPVSGVLEQGAFVHLTYALGNQPLHSLSQWGITNPLEIAWELTTLSFVVDWFLPIGNYLGCLDAANGFDFVTGSVSKVSRVHAVGENARPVSSQGMVIGQTNNFRQDTVRLDRTVYDHSPLPTVPRFKSPFSGEHTANAIALAAARLRD